jgi:hypothetical protein
VHRHTEGNPLFVTEVVRDLVQSGELTEARIVGRSSWSVRIPEGVREVIGRRLDRLSDRTNESLTFAAVIGRQFSLAALRELVQNTSESQLLDVLDEALDARIIEELPTSAGDYQFTHALIQETLTGELSAARRVRLHARIAEALERVWGEDAEGHPAELVPHYAEAEPVLGSEKLVHYSILAGEAALDATAAQDALAHFQLALDSSGDGEVDEQKACILWGLARAQAGVLDTPEMQIAFDTMLEAFNYHVEVGEIDKAVAMAGYPLVLQRWVRGGIDLANRALELVDPGSAAESRIQVRKAVALWYEKADIEQAASATDRALEIALNLGDQRLEMAALSASAVAGPIIDSREGYQRRLDATHRALELAGSDPDPVAQVRANAYSSAFHSGLGHPGEAAKYAHEAIQAAELAGSASMGETARLVGVIPHFAIGDWEGADQALDGLEALYAEGAQTPNISVLRLLARCHRGIEDGVQELLAQMLAGDLDGWNWSLPLLALIDQSMPSLGIGATLSDMIGRAIHQQGITSGTNWSPDQTDAYLAVGLNNSARADAERAWQAYERILPARGTFRGVCMDRVLGLLAESLNRRETAHDHFEDAMGFCRDSGCRPELAWTCSDYAEMLLDRDEPGDRETAIELQDEALAITQELGMRPLTERILARREILRA